MSTPTRAATRLAGSITVDREPGKPEYTVTIDGQPLPWLLAGRQGPVVEVAVDRVPSVTLTLLAASVTVDDHFLVGQDLGHDHGGDYA